jgi:son of sevenless-like protein
LQNAAVHRLNHSWGELDSRTTADYQECMTTMANDKSFKTYREKLMFASPPCVPYLGIFLTDLTFVEDGNPDLVKSKTGKMLINWKKKKMVHEVISNIKQYQYKPYDFQPVYQIQKLMDKLFSEHKQQTEEVLYKKSLELEPRGAARQSIL